MLNFIYFNDEIVEDLSALTNFNIDIKGRNNIIRLYPTMGKGIVNIIINGDNCTFHFGKDNIIRNDISICFWDTMDQRPNGSAIEIGNNNFFNGENIKFISPIKSKIVIGNRNLFAGNICFWGRNDHIIYDIKTKKRINYDKDIIINDNNWICERASFLPGGNIKDNCIIGYGTLVNKNIKKSNVLLCGVPVKIKRRNVSWSRASIYENIDFNNPITILNNEKNDATILKKN